jgi:hypothetical protein
MYELAPYYYKQIKFYLSLHILSIYLFPRCDASFGSVGMVTAGEVIPPLLFVEEANAPDEPDSDSVEKHDEQMGIFQTLDKLEEAVDALLNAKPAESSSTFQQNMSKFPGYSCKLLCNPPTTRKYVFKLISVKLIAGQTLVSFLPERSWINTCMNLRHIITNK